MLNLFPIQFMVSRFGILPIYNYIVVAATLWKGFVALMPSCLIRNYGRDRVSNPQNSPTLGY